MWLVLQIAAGIVLGWYVITHWHQLTKLALGGFQLIVGIALIALISWGGIAAWDSMASLPSHTLLKWVGTVLLIPLVILCCAGTGLLIFLLLRLARGSRALAERPLSPKQEEDRLNRTFLVGMFAGFINILIMGALINDQTLPLLRTWSRENGFADLGEFMSSALLGQWPWAILIAIWYWKHRSAKRELTP